jgi:hypothetical protein
VEQWPPFNSLLVAQFPSASHPQIAPLPRPLPDIWSRGSGSQAYCFSQQWALLQANHSRLIFLTFLPKLKPSHRIRAGQLHGGGLCVPACHAGREGGSLQKLSTWLLPQRSVLSSEAPHYPAAAPVPTQQAHLMGCTKTPPGGHRHFWNLASSSDDFTA